MKDEVYTEAKSQYPSSWIIISHVNVLTAINLTNIFYGRAIFKKEPDFAVYL